MRLGTRDRVAILAYRAMASSGVLRTAAGRSAYALLYDAYKRLADRDLLRYLDRVVRPGDVVVDVGAHLGVYTARLAGLVGHEGHVLAFEPDPENAIALRSRLAGCPMCDVREMALDERDGYATLHRGSFPADSRVYPHADAQVMTRVVTARLDSVLNGPRPSFVKLDVQGAEGRVLRGMPRTLADPRLRAVLVELWPEGLRQAGDDADDVFALLEGVGLRGLDPTTGAELSRTSALEICERRGYMDVAFHR